MILSAIRYISSFGCNANEINKEEKLLRTIDKIKSSKSVKEQGKIIDDFKKSEKKSKTKDTLINLADKIIFVGVGAFLVSNYCSELKTKNRTLASYSRANRNDEDFEPSKFNLEDYSHLVGYEKVKQLDEYYGIYEEEEEDEEDDEEERFGLRVINKEEDE